MKVSGVALVADGVTADPDWMVSFAGHLEQCGFEPIVVVEHTVWLPGTTASIPMTVPDEFGWRLTARPRPARSADVSDRPYPGAVTR
jgi:hypothetical protein